MMESNNRFVVLVFFVGLCMVFVLGYVPPPCGSCSVCMNHTACAVAKCPGGCPTLEAATNHTNNLVMMVNLTVEGLTHGFMGKVLQTYRGYSQPNIQILMQPNRDDPCLTRYFLDEKYIIAPHPGLLQECSTPQLRDGCFMVMLNQCDYFKLVSELTPNEKSILASLK
eukprot:TRINITY_DN9100_c0_g1_i1.p1 TRINITY_DN9100_c0_g1~~TRINITY_DN9100_c0_g1_i1.p1  ORF type:complete len:168 (+),score=12.70 TRINITY_DN9100_c0_g1_i1:1-504(+)